MRYRNDRHHSSEEVNIIIVIITIIGVTVPLSEWPECQWHSSHPTPYAPTTFSALFKELSSFQIFSLVSYLVNIGTAILVSLKLRFGVLFGTCPSRKRFYTLGV